ncbi:hypothetical protein [Streptomyces sp. NPDC002644]
MSACTSAGHAPGGRGLRRPAFNRPSPALLARADRGYARFLARTALDDPHNHDPDDAEGRHAEGRR